MDKFAHQVLDKPRYQAFLQWCWWITLAGSLIILLNELRVGYGLTDVVFFFVFLLYALAIPFIYRLWRTKHTQYAQHEDTLTRHQRLMHQLTQCQDWDELTGFVTQFPGLILPVKRTALFIYDHRQARLKFVAGWEASNGVTTSASTSLAVNHICQTCLLVKVPALHSAPLRALPGRQGAEPGEEFCLPLTYQSVLVGVLRLVSQPRQTFAPSQVEFMNAAASEMALALAALISRPSQIAQVRAEAQLAERRHIAHELHNSLAQQVGYLHLGLDRLLSNGRLIPDDPVRDELDHMRVVAGEVYERIRTIMVLLRSDGQANFPEAIANYARFVARQADLQINFTTEGEPLPLSAELCQALFGLVREGLNNIERHAQARQVEVCLRWSADQLEMSVIDDGIGFNPSGALQNGHDGLVMMRERAGMLGGEFSLDSAPGRGTHLSFTIPLQRPPVNSEGESLFANPALST